MTESVQARLEALERAVDEIRSAIGGEVPLTSLRSDEQLRLFWASKLRVEQVILIRAWEGVIDRLEQGRTRDNLREALDELKNGRPERMLRYEIEIAEDAARDIIDP